MNTFYKTALFCAALLDASLASGADLTIQIDDIRAATGSVMVAVYNSEGSFLKTPFKADQASVSGNSAALVIKGLPEGDYALAVYHDADANGKMDRNLLGTPTEDYAFSNNALGKMGPPSYASARFALPVAGASVRVSLK